jgi:methionine-rich copper-binding protein CopC
MTMRILILAAATVLAAIASSAAFAHAFLDHAEPRVGSTVATAPHELVLAYTQNLETAFSSVEVSDSKGARVDTGKPSISGSTMRVGLKQLPPGTYRVRWRVLSVDTHTSQGSFTFHVGK